MQNTILLVDDESDIREILSLPLCDLGYRVSEAETGDQALEIFRALQPAIVLTDIKMPGMDGIELLQKIKHENPETEVIMITGHGDMELAVRSLKNDATDFITKPINVDALEIAVQRAKDKIITREKLQEYTENLEKLIHEKKRASKSFSLPGFDDCIHLTRHKRVADRIRRRHVYSEFRVCQKKSASDQRRVGTRKIDG